MSAAEILIYDMTVQDMTRVIEIEKQSFTHKWSFSNFVSELLHPESFCKTACVDDSGMTVGYICVRLMVDEAHILRLAVHSDHRRRHIGSVLVKHVIAELLKDFTGLVILEVRVSNLPAIRLYDSLGFKSLYTRRRYYAEPDEDAVVMALDLNSPD